jgi:hypothetical protein
MNALARDHIREELTCSSADYGPFRAGRDDPLSFVRIPENGKIDFGGRQIKRRKPACMHDARVAPNPNG